MSVDRIVLRDADPTDQAWLAALYADVRRDEVAQFGWDAATAQAFLTQQFDAQQRAYRASHPDSRCQVIECPADAATSPKDRRIGRLWVDRGSDAFHVLDISVLSAWRRCGIGGHCLRGLLDEARTTACRVELFVEDRNPARRLYERLGFEPGASAPPYTAMRWLPAGAAITIPAEVCHEQA